jgi:hypothetical protein
VSHRSLRSTLVPFASGLAAVIAVSWATPALGAVGPAAAGNAVRAHEWWLADLHVNQAWQTTQGAGVTVAVLGTGVAAGYCDLVGDVVTGPDYTDSGRTPGGAFWGIEGTAVAGTIAGHGHGPGGESGIMGIAPAAKILSVRVNLEFNDPLNSDPAITRRLPDAIASGITYAVDHGARVIDLPLDPGTFGLTTQEDRVAAGGSPAEHAAVDYALRKSVLLVAPAGDDGQGVVNYPAGYAGVIAVGAVSRDGRLAAFSSKRSYVSLTAPGAALVVAAPPEGYSSFSSTSTASGMVAGVAALIMSRFPQLTAAQVTQALTRSTVGTGGTTAAPAGPGTGRGTVDAVRAVDLAAAISSAGQVRLPATPKAKPRKPPRRPVAAPRRASASALAGSLVRDVVAALGALILLLIVLVLIMRSRRRRGVTAGSGSRATRGPGVRSQAARGTHGHRRADRRSGPAPVAVGPRAALRPPLAPPPLAPTALGPTALGPTALGPTALGPTALGPTALGPTPLAPTALGPTPLAPTALGLPSPAGPGVPAAGGWPAPGGWQGGSLGEIAHTSPPPTGPVMAPAPKVTPAPRGSRAARGPGAAADSPGGPPWAPAPEPERMIGPLPVSATGSFSAPVPGPGIRVPRDMTARRPAFGFTAAPNPDLPAHSAVSDPDGAATIPDFARIKGTPPPATPPATPPAITPTITQPPITQQGLDFAAAPIPADFPAPAAGFRSGWDLAATDVFPAASDPDDDPGAAEPGRGDSPAS